MVPTVRLARIPGSQHAIAVARHERGRANRRFCRYSPIHLVSPSTISRAPSISRNVVSDFDDVSWTSLRISRLWFACRAHAERIDAAERFKALAERVLKEAAYPGGAHFGVGDGTDKALADASMAFAELLSEIVIPRDGTAESLLLSVDLVQRIVQVAPEFAPELQSHMEEWFMVHLSSLFSLDIGSVLEQEHWATFEVLARRFLECCPTSPRSWESILRLNLLIPKTTWDLYADFQAYCAQGYARAENITRLPTIVPRIKSWEPFVRSDTAAARIQALSPVLSLDAWLESTKGMFPGHEAYEQASQGRDRARSMWHGKVNSDFLTAEAEFFLSVPLLAQELARLGPGDHWAA